MTEEYETCTDEELNEYVAYAKEYLQSLKGLLTKLDTEIESPSTYRRWVAVWIIRGLGMAASKTIGEVESVPVSNKDKLL